MKKMTKIFFATILVISMALCSCSQEGIFSGDTTASMDDTTAFEQPDIDLAKHEITVSELESILASNGLETNTKRYLGNAASHHGGQQMRVCHTERGTYTAFAQDFGPHNTDELQKFYVAKTDDEGKSSLIYYGEFISDDSTITVNIGQDTNGDVWVVTSSRNSHNAIIFDKNTDEFTEYRESTDFASGETLGYSQTMFDFENRKIYAFHNGVFGSGKYLLEWYTFDIETGTWSDTSTYKWIEDTYRHVYLYPFADGKGGAYIVGIRGDSKFESEGKPEAVKLGYAWDQLDLFYIPDLSSTDNIVFTTVQSVYDERGDEGIWSYIYTQSMDVYVDKSGYMHISYLYQIYDAAGLTPDFYSGKEYHHAVYNGMECIFNEELDFIDTGYATTSRSMVRQSTDGRLHLIVAKLDGEVIELDFYSANDELGQSWKYEKNTTLDECVTTSSMTVSAVRDGSVQDNTLSAFFYGNHGYNKTGYTFNISLEDYSVTELVDILAGYDIVIDRRHDKRIPYDDRCAQIISTENGIYAVLICNCDFENRTEYYHVVKIDGEGNATVLVSDSFEANQGDKHITMSYSDGMVYVCTVTGRHAYFIDTATDEVTLRELTPILTKDLFTRQMSIISDSVTGSKYCVSILDKENFALSSNLIDPEKTTVSIKNAVKYTFDRELLGNYDNLYTLSDGKSGAYLVGTRIIKEEQLGGKLEYMGHIGAISDSVMLFYIPDLSEGEEVQCIDVQLPYEDEGNEGIWSSVKVKDVYITSDGKLNIIYSYCHFDYDDDVRNKNPELVADTLKHYSAVYDGSELVSREEIPIKGLVEDSAVRMTETSDGTVYFITCNLINIYLMDFGIYEEGQEAVIAVYCDNEGEWILAAERELGDFAADGLFACDSVSGDAVDCLMYSSTNDVYHINITFEEKK